MQKSPKGSELFFCYCRYILSPDGGHPPLIDCINGVMSSEAFSELFEERYLRRVGRGRGKQGYQKLTDVELWPIVKAAGVSAENSALVRGQERRGQEKRG